MDEGVDGDEVELGFELEFETGELELNRRLPEIGGLLRIGADDKSSVILLWFPTLLAFETVFAAIVLYSLLSLPTSPTFVS